MAYNTSNVFGGGGLDPSTPLSRAGRWLIGAMQDIGILVDCSHSSEQTSLDILAMAKRPVVASHSNVNRLNDNPRSISDRVIDGIARTGGLIGVNAWTVLLTWSRRDYLRVDNGPFPPVASISDYVDVIDYIRHRVGVDHIAMGTDWGAGGQMLPIPSQCFTFPPEMRYNEVDGLQYVKNFESVKDLPNLRAELVRRHYSASDIAKIFGGTGSECSSRLGEHKRSAVALVDCPPVLRATRVLTKVVIQCSKSEHAASGQQLVDKE